MPAELVPSEEDGQNLDRFFLIPVRPDLQKEMWYPSCLIY